MSKISAKIDQKMASNSKLVLESIFLWFLMDFWSILDQFWHQKWLSRTEETASGRVPAPQRDSKGRLDPIWECSGTPFPWRPQNSPVWSPPIDFALSFLNFETLPSFKTLLKPLRNRFWNDFGSKNGLKIDQKSIKNRCLYSTSFFARFCIKNLALHQSPELAKSIKTYWFFFFFKHFSIFSMLQAILKFDQN